MFTAGAGAGVETFRQAIRQIARASVRYSYSYISTDTDTAQIQVRVHAASIICVSVQRKLVLPVPKYSKVSRCLSGQ